MLENIYFINIEVWGGNRPQEVGAQPAIARPHGEAHAWAWRQKERGGSVGQGLYEGVCRKEWIMDEAKLARSNGVIRLWGVWGAPWGLVPGRG